MKKIKICKQCKKEYWNTKSGGRGKIFCSNSCQMTWVNINNNCQKRSDVNKKMSDIAKNGNYQQRMMTPEIRKKAAISISKANKGMIHTEEWNKNIGIGVKKAGNIPPRNIHLVGVNHTMWNGGFSSIRQKAFKTKEYRAFRYGCLKRDNFTCQKCGETNKKELNVHHIKAWGPYPESRYDMCNGITLCHQCHRKEHKGKPRPKTIGPKRLFELL